MLHDVSLAAVLPLTAKGPHMFRPCDLLASVPRSAQHDPDVNQLLLGSRGSFTQSHVDFCGLDGYLQLLSGRKVWACAPPEHRAEFFTLFSSPARACRRAADRDTGTVRHRARTHKRATMAFDHFTPAQLRLMHEHGYMFIEQHAGDVVYMPAGWPHAVRNRTRTLAVGCSYLRPWKLHFTLAHAESPDCNSHAALAVAPLDLWAVMNAFAAGEWPITPATQRGLIARAADIRARLDAIDAKVAAAQAAATELLALARAAKIEAARRAAEAITNAAPRTRPRGKRPTLFGTTADDCAYDPRKCLR